MKQEGLNSKTEEIKYSAQLEKALDVSPIIDRLAADFDLFLDGEKKMQDAGSVFPETGEENPENRLLRLIKLFMYRKRTEVQSVTKGSLLSNFDCLTLSVIACLLADRKGYGVKIARPEELSRYFHALIVKRDGGMFEVAGKDRNYKIKVMDEKDISLRLKTLKPVIGFVGSVTKSLKR